MKNKLFHYLVTIPFLLCSSFSYAHTVIAIDAGHGGKDPGAIGRNLGVKEKEVTLSIARELKALLDADPNFKAVMTRNGDYFIQLPHRTEIARKNRANYLVSIHADSSPSSDNLKGASVWVLSNRRASDELGKWLEDHEKQSELLGGAGSVLASANERYLSQTVLDLQFSHSQRSGYELGRTVLRKLSNVTSLAKSAPQHASLSVLRSPDIPSILIETGFLSNATEEQKLSSINYRRKIARAIYNGLVEYRSRTPGYVPRTVFTEAKAEKAKAEQKKKTEKRESEKKELEKKSKGKKGNSEDKQVDAIKKLEQKNANVEAKEGKNKADKESTTKSAKSESKAEIKVNPNATHHVVQQDETLYSIARMYKTSPEKLSKLNNIKENKIVVGKKLKLK